ncbi:unnamed protein product [Nezara viridula]|uniref:Uncharacterized protein n=1 Tax=Nezara viridula TaxID=85310 RepID=A0A9P0GUW9_NEZVI|nr:unnamed protein product [Nezara viridula]
MRKQTGNRLLGNGIYKAVVSREGSVGGLPTTNQIERDLRRHEKGCFSKCNGASVLKSHLVKVISESVA